MLRESAPRAESSKTLAPCLTIRQPLIIKIYPGFLSLSREFLTLLLPHFKMRHGVQLVLVCLIEPVDFLFYRAVLADTLADVPV